jgi:hypothetical protein
MTVAQAASGTTPEAADPPAAQAAPTYGWDTAFAIRVDDANATIAARKSSPPSFAATGTDSLSGTAFTADGTFGDWRITLGGSGTLLHMATPIPTMTVSANGTSWPFTGGQAVIEVELEYVPHTDQPADPAQGTLHDLVVKSGGGTAATPVVTVDALTFAEATWPEFSADVTDALGAWFNANLADFEHVFATVNLGRVADQGAFQWLLPTYTGYAYVDRDTEDDSVLGILCMTEGRPADALVAEITPNAIPAGSRAGFLISAERFLAEMVLPSLPAAFPGSAAGDFALTADLSALALGAPVQLNDVQSGGSTYAPLLQSMTVTAAAQTLTIDSTTRVEVSWQIWAYCHSTIQYEVVLKPQSDGKQTLAFQQVGTPVQENWTEKGEGVEITEIIAGIVAAVATVVVGVLTGGAGFVVAGLVAGLLVGAANAAPNVIAVVGTDDAPSIDLLVVNATDPLVWTDQRDFPLTSAGLNASLLLGGTPAFASG